MLKFENVYRYDNSCKKEIMACITTTTIIMVSQAGSDKSSILISKFFF